MKNTQFLSVLYDELKDNGHGVLYSSSDETLQELCESLSKQQPTVLFDPTGFFHEATSFHGWKLLDAKALHALPEDVLVIFCVASSCSSEDRKEILQFLSKAENSALFTERKVYTKRQRQSFSSWKETAGAIWTLGFDADADTKRIDRNPQYYLS